MRSGATTASKGRFWRWEAVAPAQGDSGAQDFGIRIDRLECAVSGSSMEEVRRSVRAFIKSRPQTVGMTHLSHACPQGGNLYFIFLAKINPIKEYLDLQ